jgi:hypothetical protein
MKRSLLEIYALSVCLVTLVCFVVALGVAVYDVIQILNPEFTLNARLLEKHQSNKNFIKDWPKKKPVPSGAKLTKLRQESYKQALRVEQREAVQSITWATIIIVLDVGLFWVHWRLARREKAPSPIA